MQTNPYVKTDWHDHIVDITNGEVIQEGTRFTAQRANNIEGGIYEAYAFLLRHDRELNRLRVQMELDGRAPGNSGTFADTFDGEPNKLVRQAAYAVLTAPRTAGTTVLNVDNTVDFAPFSQVVVFDGTKAEETLVTAVTASTITVQPLVNDYVKGAVIARSNAVIEDGQMGRGSWGTYSVEEVV